MFFFFALFLCFHIVLASKNGSGSGARKRTLSLSLPAFIKVARSSSEKNVLKSEIFKKKRRFDLIWTECVVDERTTMAIGWTPAKSEKFKYSAKINRKYTLLCLQARAKFTEFISREEMTYGIKPNVKSFPNLAKTHNKEEVTIVAVSTWNRKDICHWTKTNVHINNG